LLLIFLCNTGTVFAQL